MSKTEQILLIDPPYELKFKGPFTKPVHTFMILKNPSYKKVAFKIRSNKPEAYRLSQICGILAPQQEAKILVKLKPFGYDANERNEPRNKHIFLIQTVVVIDPVTDYGEDGKTFQWQNIEKSRIMDYKLKVSKEMPSVEQVLKSENIDEDAINVFEVNAETELQKVASEVKELREKKNTSYIPISTLTSTTIIIVALLGIIARKLLIR